MLRVCDVPVIALFLCSFHLDLSSFVSSHYLFGVGFFSRGLIEFSKWSVYASPD